MMPKLTQNVEINQTLPTHPNATLGIGAGDMKKYLDKGVCVVRDYLNNELTEAIDSLSADKIAAQELTQDSGDTVSAQLGYIFGQLQNATAGTITDGSVGAEKLSNEARGLLQRDLALTVYSTPGTYTYSAPISGRYLIILVGGGGGREGFKKYSSSEYFFAAAAPPTAGGVAIKLVSLNKGDTNTLVIGAGGKGSAVPQSGQSGDASSGGTTSFGTIFSATGGNRSILKQSQFSSLEFENTQVGTGVGGDINLSSGVSRIFAGRINGTDGMTTNLDVQEISRNIFCSGSANSLTDASALFPGGAPRGAMCKLSSGLDGANGGDGAAFILYLGKNS